MQLAGSPFTPAQTGVAPPHAASLVQLLVVELATMQTSGAPGAQCWTQMPAPHDPQLAARVLHDGSVVAVLAVVLDVVVVVELVVVSQSTSVSQLPQAVQQRW